MFCLLRYARHRLGTLFHREGPVLQLCTQPTNYHSRANLFNVRVCNSVAIAFRIISITNFFRCVVNGKSSARLREAIKVSGSTLSNFIHRLRPTSVHAIPNELQDSMMVGRAFNHDLVRASLTQLRAIKVDLIITPARVDCVTVHVVRLGDGPRTYRQFRRNDVKPRERFRLRNSSEI